MSVDRTSSPETLSVHAGFQGSNLRPVVNPIYQTSTFGFDNVDHVSHLSCDFQCFLKGKAVDCKLEKHMMSFVLVRVFIILDKPWKKVNSIGGSHFC